MRIYILFFMLLAISLYMFRYSRKRSISPSFIASFMFMGFSFIYILSMDMMNRDITRRLFQVILTFMAAMCLGEATANKIIIRTRKKHCICRKADRDEVTDILFSKYRTYAIFLLMCFAAFIRYLSVYSYGISLGLQADLFSVIGIVRNDGGYINDTGKIISSLVYVGEFAAYIYTFLFVYSIKKLRKIKYYLLLPVIGLLLMEIPSMNRNTLIQIGAAFLMSYFFCVEREKKNGLRVNVRGILCSVTVLLTAFFAYGNLIRPGKKDGLTAFRFLRVQITQYSAASLYCLDDYILNPAKYADYFKGKDFRQYIDCFLGLKDSVVRMTDYPWRIDGYPSNIFTGMFSFLQDFGFWGTAAVGFIISFASVKIENYLFELDICTYKFYIWMWVWHLLMYDIIMLPITNSFPAKFLNPGYILRMIFAMAVSYILISGLKFKYLESGVKKMRKRIKLKRICISQAAWRR